MGRSAAVPVVVHVVAGQANVGGRGTVPGVPLNSGASVPAEVLAELIDTAVLHPVSVPVDQSPQRGYR